jgi:CHAT domain-containing protein
MVRVRQLPSSHETPVVFGAPDFGANGPLRSLAVNELLEIGELLHARAITGPKADKRALTSLSSPSLLLLFTHGRFGKGWQQASCPARPVALSIWRSPKQGPESVSAVAPIPVEQAPAHAQLALAGFNRAPDDPNSVLSGLDAGSLNLLGTRLVILSACETGLGGVEVGDGVYGLQRGFMLAGAQSIAMSLWRVPDRETRHLMIAFVQELLSPTPVPRSVALANAQKIVRGMPGLAHPYFWGGFVMAGEWRPLSLPN